jgi:hypothetical protein
MSNIQHVALCYYKNLNIMKITYNQVFEFDFTGRVMFGNLSEHTLNKLFNDGRVASKFLEHHIPIWFPELQFQDGIGYDHRQISNGRKFDLKGFTMGGACYAPSNMLGKGRKIMVEQVHEHARHIDYIFSDITEFPKVRIIFKHGMDLITQFPSTRIKKNQREQLFSSQ